MAEKSFEHVLRMADVHKYFGKVAALKGINFDAMKKSVLFALVVLAAIALVFAR